VAEATRASRCAGVRAWHPNERTYQTITALAPIHNNKCLRTCSMNNSIQITTPAYKQRHGVLYPHHSQGISTPGIVLAPGVRCQGRSSTRIRRKGRMDSPFQCTAGGCPVVTFVQCRAAHGARHNMRTKDACQCHPLRLAQLAQGVMQALVRLSPPRQCSHHAPTRERPPACRAQEKAHRDAFGHDMQTIGACRHSTVRPPCQGILF
jgi:hypothetical protein